MAIENLRIRMITSTVTLDTPLWYDVKLCIPSALKILPPALSVKQSERFTSNGLDDACIGMDDWLTLTESLPVVEL